jgi:predicted ATPase
MQTRDRRPLRAHRLRLDNWRNFRVVDVPLQRRVFLVGPNASGKSNFLDSLRFLRDIVRSGGGFQEAVALRGGVTHLRCLAARRYPEIGVSVEIGPEEQPSLWLYELRFTQDNQRRPFIRAERVVRNGKVLLDRPTDIDKSDPERLTQTALEQVTANRDFRPITEFLESVRYLHLVPQLIREPDRSVGRVNDPFGGDFLERVARTPMKTREARLRRIQQGLKVAVPQLEELELFQKARGTWHIRGRYQHWRPHGAWQDEADFSDGTLRLLGLLWSVIDGTGPLLLEEPELSLHSEVVARLPQMLARVQRRAGRQIVLSSHAPELLRDEGIGLHEVLVLTPSPEGTAVGVAADDQEIHDLVVGGLDLAEALLPKTRAPHVDQLVLYGG